MSPTNQLLTMEEQKQPIQKIPDDLDDIFSAYIQRQMDLQDQTTAEAKAPLPRLRFQRRAL